MGTENKTPIFIYVGLTAMILLLGWAAFRIAVG